SSKNYITFPKSKDVVFIGTPQDPPEYHVKSAPAIGIEKHFYYPGGTTWEFPVVVSPDAPPGPIKVALAKCKILICKKVGDEEKCLPPETVPVSATLTVLNGPAIPVEERFKDEVAKALGTSATPPAKEKEPRAAPKETNPPSTLNATPTPQVTG